MIVYDEVPLSTGNKTDSKLGPVARRGIAYSASKKVWIDGEVLGIERVNNWTVLRRPRSLACCSAGARRGDMVGAELDKYASSDTCVVRGPIV